MPDSVKLSGTFQSIFLVQDALEQYSFYAFTDVRVILLPADCGNMITVDSGLYGTGSPVNGKYLKVFIAAVII